MIKADVHYAFPCAFPAPAKGDMYIHEPGMTLRDYFAAAALPAAIAKAKHNWAFDNVAFSIEWDHIATSCYDAADAMLAERAK